jgi:hypothetical protein
MSNHRDIALDPAFVNCALYHNGHSTVRIAIGDNLLTKDYVSDLMRLNKSFIVKRSAKGPRQIFAAYMKLSGYIRYSIEQEQHPVWIAQREGRAKDGVDRTEPAILKMLAMSQDKEETQADALARLNIVPVAISYEYDPCDIAKARELYHRQVDGGYEKGEQEDIESIAAGIAGQKGAVHLSFGEVLGKSSLAEAEAAAAAVDRQVVDNYVLFPSNYFAYEMLHGKVATGCYGPDGKDFNSKALAGKRKEFEQRLSSCPEAYRDFFLASYANAVVSKQA